MKIAHSPMNPTPTETALRGAGLFGSGVAGLPAGRTEAVKSVIEIFGTPPSRKSKAPLQTFEKESTLQDNPLQTCLANELGPLHEGWVRISPYGDFPKERPIRRGDGLMSYERYLQRVDRKAADLMVRAFNTLWGSPTLGKIKRFLVGTPIYKGHPDLPERPQAHADETRYGMITALEAGPDGLYGRIVLTEDAHDLIVRDGLQWLSPFWLVRLTGQSVDGVPVCTPVRLLSAGLTRSPNIRGGQALANETQSTHMEKSLLIELLGLAQDASDAQIQSAIADLKSKAAQLSPLENQMTQLENENAGFRDRLQQERQNSIRLLLDHSLSSGRITAGERAYWEKALANEDQYEARAAEISQLPPKVKTKSVTGGLGPRHHALENESDRRSLFLALVAEKQSKGASYDEAFAAVQRECPELIQRMRRPGGDQ